VVGAYVATPLVWGKHANAEYYSADHDVSADDRRGGKPKKFAVSRIGSGSHLMALVDATMRGARKPTDDELVVVGSLLGARDALRENEADYFLWEKFMTKPLVDSGEWVRLAEVPTPWPCFAVVASDRLLADDLATRSLVAALGVVRERADALVAADDAAERVAHEYDLQPEDAKIWLGTVRWCARPEMPRTVVDTVVDHLLDAGILKEDQLPEDALAYETIVAENVTQDVAVLS